MTSVTSLGGKKTISASGTLWTAAAWLELMACEHCAVETPHIACYGKVLDVGQHSKLGTPLLHPEPAWLIHTACMTTKPAMGEVKNACIRIFTCKTLRENVLVLSLGSAGQ